MQKAINLDNEHVQALNKIMELKRETLRHFGKRDLSAATRVASQLPGLCQSLGLNDTVVSTEIGSLYGAMLLKGGQFDRAATVLGESLRQSTSLLAENDVEVLIVRMRLGEACLWSRRVFDAERYIRETLAGATCYSPTERYIHPGAEKLEYNCRLRLAVCLYGLQDYDAAEEAVCSAERIRECEHISMGHDEVWEVIIHASINLAKGNAGGDVSVLERAMDAFTRHDAEGSVFHCDVIVAYTHILIQMDRIPEAREALAGLDRLPANDGRGGEYLELRGRLLAKSGQFEQSAAVLTEALAEHDRSLGTTHPFIIYTLQRCIEVNHVLGYETEVQRLKLRLKRCEERLAKYKAERAKWLSEK